jgi:carbon monoxide dehydrogenase subunit G
MVISRISIDVMRSPADVWEFLMEPANYALWMSGVTDVSTTNGMNLGSEVTFTSIGLGKQLTLKAVVTDNDGSRHFSAKNVQGPVTFETRYSLSEFEGGTRVDIINKVDTHVVFRLAESVLQSVSDSKNESDLRSLKAIMESDPVAI